MRKPAVAYFALSALLALIAHAPEMVFAALGKA